MDKRISYYQLMDSETCNGISLEGNKTDLSQSLPYDIGWAVIDKYGRVYEKRSFIVREIFFGMRDLMKSAYYADKIPQYEKDIADGKRIVASIWDIWKQFRADSAEWNVKAIVAHNARFDVNALNNAVRYLTQSRVRFFLPYGVEVWDTMKMAQDVVATQKTYVRYCIQNEYLTNHLIPRPRITAEILYRYISGNNEFSESHTGLEDVEIEKEILAYCFRQHKAMRKKLWEN